MRLNPFASLCRPESGSWLLKDASFSQPSAGGGIPLRCTRLVMPTPLSYTMAGQPCSRRPRRPLAGEIKQRAVFLAAARGASSGFRAFPKPDPKSSAVHPLDKGIQPPVRQDGADLGVLSVLAPLSGLLAAVATAARGSKSSFADAGKPPAIGLPTPCEKPGRDAVEAASVAFPLTLATSTPCWGTAGVLMTPRGAAQGGMTMCSMKGLSCRSRTARATRWPEIAAPSP